MDITDSKKKYTNCWLKEIENDRNLTKKFGIREILVQVWSCLKRSILKQKHQKKIWQNQKINTEIWTLLHQMPKKTMCSLVKCLRNGGNPLHLEKFHVFGETFIRLFLNIPVYSSLLFQFINLTATSVPRGSDIKLTSDAGGLFLLPSSLNSRSN